MLIINIYSRILNIRFILKYSWYKCVNLYREKSKAKCHTRALPFSFPPSTPTIFLFLHFSLSLCLSTHLHSPRTMSQAGYARSQDQAKKRSVVVGVTWLTTKEVDRSIWNTFYPDEILFERFRLSDRITYFYGTVLNCKQLCRYRVRESVRICLYVCVCM